MLAVLGRYWGFINTVLRKDDPRTDDPWKGSHEFYIGDCRSQLDEIAAALSATSDFEVTYATRFNKELKCAEIYDAADGVVVAEVSLRGEFGKPYSNMTVTTNLPIYERDTFQRFLPFDMAFCASDRLRKFL